MTLKQQMKVKDWKMRDFNDQAKSLIENEKRILEAIDLELRELHAQLETKDQMVRALENYQSIEVNYVCLQQEEQLKSNVNEYFKEKLKNYIQTVLEKKAVYEQQIFEEYEKLSSTNFTLSQENKRLKSQIESQQKCEITISKQPLIQAKLTEDKQTSQQTQFESEEKIMINQEIENIKTQFQTQSQELQILRMTKFLTQPKNSITRNNKLMICNNNTKLRNKEKKKIKNSKHN